MLEALYIRNWSPELCQQKSFVHHLKLFWVCWIRAIGRCFSFHIRCQVSIFTLALLLKVRTTVSVLIKLYNWSWFCGFCCSFPVYSWKVLGETSSRSCIMSCNKVVLLSVLYSFASPSNLFKKNIYIYINWRKKGVRRNWSHKSQKGKSTCRDSNLRHRFAFAFGYTYIYIYLYLYVYKHIYILPTEEQLYYKTWYNSSTTFRPVLFKSVHWERTAKTTKPRPIIQLIKTLTVVRHL